MGSCISLGEKKTASVKDVPTVSDAKTQDPLEKHEREEIALQKLLKCHNLIKTAE
jgi:hypothetical protein